MVALLFGAGMADRLLFGIAGPPEQLLADFSEDVEVLLAETGGDFLDFIDDLTPSFVEDFSEDLLATLF